MMKTIKYILVNSAFAACLYFGLYENVEGAENVAVFYAWLMFFCSTMMVTDVGKKSIKDNLSKNGLSVPRALDAIFGIAATCAFVWYGFVWTGLFYLIHAILTHSVLSEILKEIKEECKNES